MTRGELLELHMAAQLARDPELTLLAELALDGQPDACLKLERMRPSGPAETPLRPISRSHVVAR